MRLSQHAAPKPSQCRGLSGAARTCSGLPVLGGGEAVPLRNDDGGDAQDADDGEVDESWLRGAVERVVEPRDEAPHDQQCNS